MAFTTPTVSDFKTRFDRDFTFGTGKETIRDSDVTNALNDAAALFNSAIWDDTESPTAYLLLSAHLLVINIRAAGGLAGANGINAVGGGIVQSKSVGQVSVSYGIPQRILEDPFLNQFSRTEYGLRYLQILGPRLVGNMQVVSGRALWADNSDV